MKLILAIFALGMCTTLCPVAVCATAAPGPAPVKASAGQATPVLDINSASAEEFETIRGIGPVLAQRIVEYRVKRGSFQKIDDLLEVAGIGMVNLEDFRPHLRVSATVSTTK
jgi:competence protein ComEA